MVLLSNIIHIFEVSTMTNKFKNKIMENLKTVHAKVKDSRGQYYWKQILLNGKEVCKDLNKTIEFCNYYNIFPNNTEYKLK